VRSFLALRLTPRPAAIGRLARRRSLTVLSKAQRHAVAGADVLSCTTRSVASSTRRLIPGFSPFGVYLEQTRVVGGEEIFRQGPFEEFLQALPGEEPFRESCP
jgi:hypothetical protein